MLNTTEFKNVFLFVHIIGHGIFLNDFLQLKFKKTLVATFQNVTSRNEKSMSIIV